MKNLLLLAFALVLCTFSSSAQLADRVPGQLIVKLKSIDQKDDLTRQCQNLHGVNIEAKVNRILSKRSNIVLLEFDESALSGEKTLDILRALPQVVAAQFNHTVTERATIPNDPQIGSQWHHVDASDNDIDTDLAWDITTGGTTVNGDEIVVCVIEGGGSNYNHQDLIDNHWTNTQEIDGNGIDDDGNGYVDDVNGWDPVSGTDNIGAGGHGTAVSGMIGAKGNNGIGVAGVNWDVKIMQVEVGGLNEANVIAAYSYPYDMRAIYNATNGAQGAFVVATNASWGIDNANPANYPVWCAFYDDLGAEGILNCGATANNNVNVDVVGDMPTGCSSDYMVAVTATNSSDARTFSGYGATSIDLGAPGESVFLPSGSTSYSNTSGTSFASPCVAGAIALMYSAPCSDLAALAISNPQQAADLVRTYLFQGVDPVAQLASETVTGGRLNVKNSLDLILNNCGPLPPCDPVSIAGTSECYFDDAAGQIRAGIDVSVSISENFCEATSLCYAENNGGFTCIDLIAAGEELSNVSNYFLSNLNPNANYQVYFTTADGTSNTITISTADCSNEVAACTNPLATNYNANATIDDGSCVIPCENVTLTLDTDCWGYEVSWQLTDSQGNVIASVNGTYGNQQSYTWTGCLDYGCYTFSIQDSFGDGLAGIASGCAVDGNYNMVDSQGNVLFQMGTPNYGAGTSHAFCVPVALPGCTDAAACNYNPAASTDDGSCEFLSCAGCTDAAACNYDASATINDGSCESLSCAGCTNLAACNYDATATIDDGSCDLLSCAGCTDAAACNYDATATIDDGSCDLSSCAGCTDAAACNYDASATIDDGSCDLLSCAGCTDAAACNYDATATIDDGSCDLTSCVGCTDAAACNYDATATIDDGSCEFSSCVCPGDMNNDGSRDVSDLLMVLGSFGCNGACGPPDMNTDGVVNGGDVLMFLSFFGTNCP
ncbi:MAG: S8 family serine peptidase [Flavobacteriales bacterium]|nr:S8 family serine peptidase [Flavobacteriales bacterium]